METRRMVLWMIFSVSLFTLWDNWQRAQGHPTLFGVLTGVQQKTPAKAVTNPLDAKALADKSVAELPSSSTQSPSDLPLAPVAGQPANSERVVVETDVLKLTFDTLGAQVVEASLLKHPDTEIKDKELQKPVLLLESGPQRTYLAQTGLIGVPDAPNHRTTYRLVSEKKSLSQSDNALEVKFEAVSANLKLLQIYTLKRGQYNVGLRYEVSNTAAAPVSPSVYLQLTRDSSKAPGESKFYSTFTGPAVYSNESKYKKVSFSDIDKNVVDYAKLANDGWVAMVQHYFVSAFVPKEGTSREFYTRKISDQLYAVGTLSKLPALASGAMQTYDATLYLGPQDQRALENVATGLELVRDYGWLTIISKPLFWLLEHLYALVGNWGWAIVLLTVIVKLAFFPLSAASYKSMAKMRKLTPRMTKLREQYADDKMKLNQAMMEMYKTEKINPLGGCLPVVVQIPVFLALYWVLLASVEMRNAPWLGWVHDLAQPDPFYILPVVMAATMFLQTKLNPTPPDPVQAKIMMIMPLVFSFMFLFFPAGLVLYWVVNNILSISQQWYITRLIDGGKP